MTTRRDFLKTTAGAGMGVGMGVVPATVLEGAPALHLQAVTPTVV
ncbi:MAG: twin-arginine translocation signal domain-containing protein, partial [Gemmatimonadetes bacterium]|nr:twin-arginine translocation signal domain-containing protein [Gemmatimonadota bacterium]